MIPIDIEKTFDVIQCPFITKTFNKLGDKGGLPQPEKGCLWKSVGNIIPNRERINHSPKDQEQDKDVFLSHFYSTLW